ncbi:D-glycero-beta-D-manno-heptose 1,7-bisphosphate 7-phosphatase [Salinicola endophyticus]|uniref:D,D-heptose 1,7-bisphosphate phosphatase n=1 Tax=Salinicola endophyticus TaxID=1949083 RepID=A0ABY8FML0_9GAMM|nr:D-glycero-beta-D-manno-heptose 1,7-bisphosphate 7-phosphatase [Salinicola endophyticus]WFF41124.1 D-glycero-beta-D-manno-heptose 1,7-bisphosphate 7-phosphatase [Salinicola endophyticus]
MQKLVILDRDGVINEDSDAYIKSLDEWHPYPTAIEAIATLTRAGWQVAIATNQSGIGRGYYSRDTLEAIHARLHTMVRQAGGEIAHIAYCPHLPQEACDCRKPKPGLLFQIQQALALPTLAGGWMVGDSLRDIEAGIAAGTQTALVNTGKGERYASDVARDHPETWRCDDLADFVRHLLKVA